MNDRLCQLRQLLHTKRVCSDWPVTRLGQADVEQSFVCPLQSHLAGKAGKLSHHLDERHCRHLRDESVVLRHVAYEFANLSGTRLNVVSVHVGGACRRLVKTQQSVDESGFPCTVRTQEPDGAPAQRGIEATQNFSRAEPDRDILQLDERRQRSSRRLRLRNNRCSVL